MKHQTVDSTRDTLKGWAHRSGVSTDAMLRLGTPPFEISAGSGPRERQVELTEVNGASLARVFTVSTALLGLLVSMAWFLFFLFDLRIDLPGISAADAWFQVPLVAGLVLLGMNLTVRLLCWSYNRIAGRFGGIVVRVRD